MKSPHKSLNSLRTLIFSGIIFGILLFILLIISYWIIHSQIISDGSYAALVNKSGRQRMLAQNIALGALQLVTVEKSSEKEHIRSKLNETINHMEKSHGELLLGDPGKGLAKHPLPAVSNLYNAPPVYLDKTVKDYLKEARLLIAIPNEQLTVAPPHFQSILLTLNKGLINDLDELAMHFQKAGEMHIRKLDSLVTIILWIESLLLLVMSILIFRPLVMRSLKENSALADSEERYRNLVELSPDAVLLHSGGKVDYVNNSGAKLLGASDMNDLIGKPIMDFISPEQRELVKKRIEMSKRGEKLPYIEEKLIRLDGKSVYIEGSGSSFNYKGKIVTQAILRDITAFKKSEAMLRQLIKAVETTQLGITIADVESKIIYVNSAEARQHGYEVDELIGKDVEIFAPSKLYKKMAIEDLALMDNRNWESINIRKNGTTFPVHLTTDIVRNESSEPIAIVTTCEDITGRKVAEKELKEAKERAEIATIAKSEFLASMSHEIRTPMTSIIGIMEVLSDSPLNDEQQKAIRILRGASENLLALISDILDLSKIEAGHLELEEVEFRLEELMSEIESFMGVAARGKGLEMSYHIDPDIPVNFIGDPKHLRQIIFNLVSNAVKFTKKGRVDINVRRTGTKDDIIELEFHIKDTGIGISEDSLDIIFERFTQADSSTTRVFGGTGLGTAISKSLVEAMGGSIWVESELGEGSTFCFTVKLKISETAEDEKTIKKGGGKGKSISWGRPLRILVAEDSEDNRNLILMHLTKTPHIVDIVENGRAAVEKFQSANYDLVLMDMEMPVMDGCTATKEIRKWETEEKKKQTPIVALTAHALKEHEQKSIDSGCTGHFTKPFKKQKLLEVIQEYSSNSP